MARRLSAQQGWAARPIVMLLAAAVFLVAVSNLSAQVVRQRIVSTSGVPHGDVANLRRSPFWRPGMPTGLNSSWVRFLQTEIADITSGADVALHQGDQVAGRWGQDCDGRGVFGPIGTFAERIRALTLPPGTSTTRVSSVFGATATCCLGWATTRSVISPRAGSSLTRTFTYRAHRYWNRVWRRHYGPSR